jgi:hypothetical protein
MHGQHAGEAWSHSRRTKRNQSAAAAGRSSIRDFITHQRAACRMSPQLADDASVAARMTWQDVKLDAAENFRALVGGHGEPSSNVDICADGGHPLPGCLSARGLANCWPPPQLAHEFPHGSQHGTQLNEVGPWEPHTEAEDCSPQPMVVSSTVMGFAQDHPTNSYEGHELTSDKQGSAQTADASMSLCSLNSATSVQGASEEATFQFTEFLAEAESHAQADPHRAPPGEGPRQGPHQRPPPLQRHRATPQQLDIRPPPSPSRLPSWLPSLCSAQEHKHDAMASSSCRELLFEVSPITCGLSFASLLNAPEPVAAVCSAGVTARRLKGHRHGSQANSDPSVVTVAHPDLLHALLDDCPAPLHDSDQPGCAFALCAPSDETLQDASWASEASHVRTHSQVACDGWKNFSVLLASRCQEHMNTSQADLVRVEAKGVDAVGTQLHDKEMRQSATRSCSRHIPECLQAAPLPPQVEYSPEAWNHAMQGGIPATPSLCQRGNRQGPLQLARRLSKELSLRACEDPGWSMAARGQESGSLEITHEHHGSSDRIRAVGSIQPRRDEARQAVQDVSIYRMEGMRPSMGRLPPFSGDQVSRVAGVPIPSQSSNCTSDIAVLHTSQVRGWKCRQNGIQEEQRKGQGSTCQREASGSNDTRHGLNKDASVQAVCCMGETDSEVGLTSGTSCGQNMIWTDALETPNKSGSLIHMAQTHSDKDAVELGQVLDAGWTQQQVCGDDVMGRQFNGRAHREGESSTVRCEQMCGLPGDEVEGMRRQLEVRAHRESGSSTGGHEQIDGSPAGDGMDRVGKCVANMLAELEHLKQLRQQLAAEITALKAPATGSIEHIDTDSKHPEEVMHFEGASVDPQMCQHPEHASEASSVAVPAECHPLGMPAQRNVAEVPRETTSGMCVPPMTDSSEVGSPAQISSLRCQPAWQLQVLPAAASGSRPPSPPGGVHTRPATRTIAPILPSPNLIYGQGSTLTCSNVSASTMLLSSRPSARPPPVPHKDVSGGPQDSCLQSHSTRQCPPGGRRLVARLPQQATPLHEESTFRRGAPAHSAGGGGHAWRHRQRSHSDGARTCPSKRQQASAVAARSWIVPMDVQAADPGVRADEGVDGPLLRLGGYAGASARKEKVERKHKSAMTVPPCLPGLHVVTRADHHACKLNSASRNAHPRLVVCAQMLPSAALPRGAHLDASGQSGTVGRADRSPRLNHNIATLKNPDCTALSDASFNAWGCAKGKENGTAKRSSSRCETLPRCDPAQAKHQQPAKEESSHAKGHRVASSTAHACGRRLRATEGSYRIRQARAFSCQAADQRSNCQPSGAHTSSQRVTSVKRDRRARTRSQVTGHANTSPLTASSLDPPRRDAIACLARCLKPVASRLPGPSKIPCSGISVCPDMAAAIQTPLRPLSRIPAFRPRSTVSRQGESATSKNHLSASFDRDFGDLARDPEVIAMIEKQLVSSRAKRGHPLKQQHSAGTRCSRSAALPVSGEKGRGVIFTGGDGMGVHEPFNGQDTNGAACKGAGWEEIFRERGEGEEQVRGGRSELQERPNIDVQRNSQVCLSTATVMQLDPLPPAAVRCTRVYPYEFCFLCYTWFVELCMYDRHMASLPTYYGALHACL